MATSFLENEKPFSKNGRAGGRTFRVFRVYGVGGLRLRVRVLRV